MLDSSPLLISKSFQSLHPFLQAFTLQLYMFHTFLLEHLLHPRMQTPMLAKHNRLEGNHHLMNLSLLEDYQSMVGLPILEDSPLFMLLLEGNLHFPFIPWSLIHHWQGETFVCWKPFTIPRSIFRRHFHSTPHWGALIS
jgi:hypothetical protein